MRRGSTHSSHSQIFCSVIRKEKSSKCVQILKLKAKVRLDMTVSVDGRIDKNIWRHTCSPEKDDPGCPLLAYIIKNSAVKGASGMCRLHLRYIYPFQTNFLRCMASVFESAAQP